MPTRNVNLTDDQDAFVEKMVRAGKYQNASEAMRDAVRGLQQRWQEDELKLELLRKSIDTGIADLENGNYEDIDDAALEGWLVPTGKTTGNTTGKTTDKTTGA